MRDENGNSVLPGTTLINAQFPGVTVHCIGFGVDLNAMRFEIYHVSGGFPVCREFSHLSPGWLVMTKIENVFRCPYCGGSVDRFPLEHIPFECRDCGAIGDALTGIMMEVRHG